MNSELSQNMGRKRGAKNQIAASTSEEIHHIETIILNPEEGAAGDDVGPPHEANKVQQNISPLVSDRANFQRELQVAVDEAVQGAMQEVMQSVNNTVRDTVKDMRTAIENQISTEQIQQEQTDGTRRKSRLREVVDGDKISRVILMMSWIITIHSHLDHTLLTHQAYVRNLDANIQRYHLSTGRNPGRLGIIDLVKSQTDASGVMKIDSTSCFQNYRVMQENLHSENCRRQSVPVIKP